MIVINGYPVPTTDWYVSQCRHQAERRLGTRQQVSRLPSRVSSPRGVGAKGVAIRPPDQGMERS